VTAAVWVDVARLGAATAHEAQGVEADLAFAHPAIADVLEIDLPGGRVALAVSDGAPVDRADLERQVRLAVAASIDSFRFVPDTPPLWRHDPGAPASGAALDAFVARHVVELGPGQYALAGPAARLRVALDARLAALAADAGAEPWHLPSIESTADLLRVTGYFASHPQHVTWGFHVTPHFEGLASFATQAVRDALEAPSARHAARPTGFILEPFVCHNVYRALRGARVEQGRSITAIGNCYRFEGHRFEPLQRQWEFSMREVVLLGSGGYVESARERLLDLTRDLVAELDLDATVDVATDPFFASEAAPLRTFQAMRSTKLELRLAVGGGARVAAASFNLHGGVFAAPMEIRTGDELAETACVAWGIERWMAAFVARWGADPAFWPELAPR
jgi:seryl-tRNA synthetase